MKENWYEIPQELEAAIQELEKRKDELEAELKQVFFNT